MADKAILVQITNNEKEIIDISKAAQELLAREHKIGMSNFEGYPTIVSAFLRTAIAYLAEHKSTTEDVVIDLFGLLDIGVTFRESEDGENDGNFTPFATAGPEFRKKVKDNDVTESED